MFHFNLILIILNIIELIFCLYIIKYYNIINLINLWMYFATFLKTTAPVKLPISHLSFKFLILK